MQILPKHSGITKGGAVASPNVEAQGQNLSHMEEKSLQQDGELPIYW